MEITVMLQKHKHEEQYVFENGFHKQSKADT